MTTLEVSNQTSLLGPEMHPFRNCEQRECTSSKYSQRSHYWENQVFTGKFLLYNLIYPGLNLLTRAVFNMKNVICQCFKIVISFY